MAAVLITAAWPLASVPAAEAHLGDRFVVEPRTTETGLPQNSVQCLLQTSDGYLWIGTRRGLARFDGLRFRIFDRHNTPALDPSDSCSALFEDAEGTLWIGTAEGLVRRREGRFAHFDIGPNPEASRVWLLAPATDGGLWIGSSGGLRYWRDGTAQRVAGLESQGNITGVIEDSDGTLWVGDEWQFRQRPAGAAGFKDLMKVGDGKPWEGTHYLQRDNAGTHWFSNSSGIWRWRDGTAGQVLPGPFPDIPVLAPRRQGGLWVYSPRDGLGIGEGDQIRWVGKAEEIPATDLQVIHEDRNGNLWLGTRAHGLLRLQPRRLVNYTVADGLPGNDVWSLSEGPDGRVWAATGKGLGSFGGRRWERLDVPTTTKGILEYANDFSVVCADRSGVVWAASDMLRCVREGRLELAPLRHPQHHEGVPDGVETIYPARDGSLWVAAKGGVFHWNATRTELLTTADGLSHGNVVGILEDAEGGLWFGGSWEPGRPDAAGWVDRWHQGRWTAYGASNGLPKDKVGPVLAETDGRVWFGSGSGLLSWKAGRFRLITTDDGLAENVVGGLLPDDHGWFWFFGHRGIHRVRQDELRELADGHRPRVHCITYGESDGMSSAEGNAGVLPSCCRTRDGRLWFPTASGVVVADPAVLLEQDQPPAVVIEEVRADRQPLNGDDIRASKAGPGPHWQLAPGQAQNLAVRYTAPTFTAPGRTRFRYQLEGQDRDWNEPAADADRVAYYTNLRPGPYRFRVQAAGRRDDWGAPAEFAFTLAPHFYETSRFYLLCATAVLAMGGGLHLLRMRGLRRIEQLERLHALDQQRTRIARDLHDDLGADLSRLAILSERLRLEDLPPEANRSQLQTIAASSREMVESIRELVWATDPRNDLLENLVAYVREYVAEVIEEAGLRARLDFAEELPRCQVSSEFRRNVFLAVKEALANVLKHAQATEVTIGFRALPRHQIEIRVADNGRGFDPSAVGGFHNGLRNLRQRLEALGGTLTVNAEPGQGTTVQMLVPLASNDGTSTPRA